MPTTEQSGTSTIYKDPSVIVAESIAELRKSKLNTGRQLAFVTGQSASADGTRIDYVWDADSTAADDGFDILRPNSLGLADSGRWRRIKDSEPLNVRWFGATGDGAADDTDTDAFSDALSAASLGVFKVVIVPDNRTYLIDSITIPAGVTLDLGEGTIKRRTFNSTATSALVTMSANSTLRRGTLDGNSGSLTRSNTTKNYGILISGDGAEISGVTIQNTFDQSIFANGYDDLKILSVTDSGVGRGPELVLCDRATVRDYANLNGNFIFSSIFQHCLDFFSCRDLSVNGIRIYNPTSSASAPSGAISGVTLGTCINSVLENVVIDTFGNDIDYAAAFLDDGSVNTAIGNVVIRGWGGGIGVEIAACRNSSYSNFHVDMSVTTGQDNSGEVGFHLLDTGIQAAISGQEGAQNRARSTATGNSFSNFKIIGPRDGFVINGSNNTFVNCHAEGGINYAWRIMPKDAATITSYFEEVQDHYVDNNTFIGCSGTYYGLAGLSLWTAGDGNRFVDCRFDNNGQGGSGSGVIWSRRQAGTTTSATSNTLTTGSSLQNWAGKYLYIDAGTGVGQIKQIKSTTTNVFTIEGTFSPTPDATSIWAVIDGNQTGTTRIINSSIRDDQSWTLTDGGSIDPRTAAFTSATRLQVMVRNGEKIHIGQHIKLVGALSGGSDLTVKVIELLSETSADDFICLPTSPTSGTIGTSGTAGTGTIATDPTASTETNKRLITGTGTLFGEEMDAHYWIKANGEWRQVWRLTDNTTAYVLEPFTTGFSGESFEILKFDVQGVPSQEYAFAFDRFPGKLLLQGDNVVSGNVTGIQNLTTSAGFGKQTFVDGDTTPSVADGEYFATANTGATTITNFDGAYTGKRIRVAFGDANTTVSFSGANIKGNNGINYTSTVNEILEATFDGTLWRAFVSRATSTLAGPLTVSRSGAGEIFKVTRSDDGSNLAWNSSSGRVHAIASSGIMMFSDVVTDATTKNGRMSIPHYTVAEEPFTWLYAQSTTSDNLGNIGGGTGLGNAASRLSFWTAADNVTTTGTERLRINSAGNIQLHPGGSNILVSVGTGSPEGAVTANVGSLFLRSDGGASTTLYVKESGTGNTGWVAK